MKPGRLPLKIWRDIGEKCDADAAASLALSCSSLYSLADLRAIRRDLTKPGNDHQRMSFLRNLQRSLPAHFLCPSCQVFHRRPKHWNKESRLCELTEAPPIYTKHPCHLSTERMTLLSPGDLEWRLAHLVMRSYWLSPQHGIKTSILRSRQDLSIESIPHYGTTDGFISGYGHLILRVVTSTPVDYDDFAGYDTDSVDFRTCGHHGRTPYALQRACKLARQWISTSRGERFLFSSSSCRCQQCPSEYAIWLNNRRMYGDVNAWGKRPAGNRSRLPFAIVVVRYIDLGRCMSPEEPEWQAIRAPACPIKQEETPHGCRPEEILWHHLGRPNFGPKPPSDRPRPLSFTG